jgi:hypothetical protein
MQTKLDAAAVKAQAQGRWRDILTHVGGIPADLLDGEHRPCPKCNGKDRFRLMDEEAGAVICNQCFRHANGDGLSAIQWARTMTFPEALAAVAEYCGAIPAPVNGNGHAHKGKPAELVDPAKDLVFHDWTEDTDMLLEGWCSSKPPITAAAVKSVGGRIAHYYRRWWVVAIPVWGESLDAASPIGWSLYNVNGEGLPRTLRSGADHSDTVKVKLTYGSEKGLIGDLARLRSASEVWKVEGPSDCLAMLSDPTLPNSVAVITNANGAGERPEEWFVSLLADKVCRVVHDADKAGEEGAKGIPATTKRSARAGWVEAIASKATECRHVRLPYKLAAKDDPGRDLRDYLNGLDLEKPGSYEQLQALARKVLPYGAAPVTVKPEPKAKAEPGAASSKKFLGNGYIDGHGKSEEVIPISLVEIIKNLLDITDGWPRRVKNTLFVHDVDAADRTDWLPNSSSLFGWIQSKVGVVDWHRAVGCVTKDEIYAELLRKVQSYESIETFPHFDPLPDHYYACLPRPKCDMTYFTKLVDCFCPATGVDQQLIMAMFATPFWGGRPGTRPMFLITSDDGRGVGKTKITDKLCRLTGGIIELQTSEDAGRTRSRLLSREGLKMRVARLDNVKSLRFSWAELESMITAPILSGHELNKGESSRPNNLTWLMTLNGASLGTDMTQRVIPIKLKRPDDRMGAWESEVDYLIDNHRQEILEGIAQFFKIEPAPIPEHSRWAAWEDAVLARLETPYEIQRVIRERALEMDVELDELETVEDYFTEQLIGFGYRLGPQLVHISSKVAATWYCKATNEKRSNVSAGRILMQFVKEGRSSKLSINPSRSNGRGFLFAMGDVTKNTKADYNLDDMIERRYRGHEVETYATGEF